MKILSCPWCQSNAKVLYLDDTGTPMFICTECHLTDNLMHLLKDAVMEPDKVRGGGDE